MNPHSNDNRTKLVPPRQRIDSAVLTLHPTIDAPQQMAYVCPFCHQAAVYGEPDGVTGAIRLVCHICHAVLANSEGAYMAVFHENKFDW